MQHLWSAGAVLGVLVVGDAVGAGGVTARRRVAMTRRRTRQRPARALVESLVAGQTPEQVFTHAAAADSAATTIELLRELAKADALMALARRMMSCSCASFTSRISSSTVHRSRWFSGQSAP